MANSSIPFEFEERGVEGYADSFDVWDRVFDDLYETKCCIKDTRKLESFIKNMIRKLLLCGCSNTQTVLRVAMVYERWIRSGLGLGFGIIPLGAQSHFDYILEPFNRENNYHLLDVSDGDKFITAIDIGDVRCVELLIKYGKTFLNSRFYNISLGVMYLQTFMHYIWSQKFRYEIDYASCWQPASDVIDAMLNTNGRIGNNERGFVRIFIILRILNNIICKKTEYDMPIRLFEKDRIQCLQLYYRAINEPFVPHEEIRDFLRYLFCNEGNREDTLEELVNIYRGMFPPESIRVYEPRSLKHQARCVVRSTLSYKDIPLPNIVSQLNFSVDVQNLLLGECEFSSRTG